MKHSNLFTLLLIVILAIGTLVLIFTQPPPSVEIELPPIHIAE